MVWVCKYCSSNNTDDNMICEVCDNSRNYSRTMTLTTRKAEVLGLNGEVNIPEEYNVIGQGAFKSREDIKRVVLPSSIKKISPDAFYGCINLEEIICNGKLSSIGSKAFGNCLSLPTYKRPIASRYTAEDAFMISPELSIIDNEINKLNDCINRCNKLVMARRNREENIEVIEQRQAIISEQIIKLKNYKINFARGIAEPNWLVALRAKVAFQIRFISQCEEEDREAERIKRQNELFENLYRSRAKQIERKRNKKKKVLSGLLLGGAAAIILTIVMLSILL